MREASPLTGMVRHLAISASAGSGKTYQLAHRYIGLLLRGEAPERIVALTFSRKAAGEIFDSIVKYLVGAAGSEAKREQLAADCGIEGLDQILLLAVLRRLLASLHRLQVSTLDSFAVRLLSGFPVEFGIDYGFEIIDNDGAAAMELRREVLLRLLGRDLVRGEDRQRFLEAFRLATFGREEKRLSELLQRFVVRFQELYLQAPDRDCWGNAARIWPHGVFWQSAATDPGPLADELAELVNQQVPEKVVRRWLEFIDEARNHRVGRPVQQPLKYFLGKILPLAGQLNEGRVELQMDRTTYEIDGRLCLMTLELVRYLLRLEMEAACTKTRGIFEVVGFYENLYEQAVRRRGKLTFNDVHFLLGPDNRLAQGLTLSSARGAGRLFVDYRLDASIDHWLLDEFQDTSTLQWRVLENLVDEVLQDTEGRRTFFYVGDVKQAIYRWRSGNADLFCQILRRYEGLIEERPMDRSFRSCQPVIDTVNEVFSELPAELPAEAVRDWRAIWRQHLCEPSKVPRTGYAALLEPVWDGGEKPTAEDRYAIVADLLQEIEPLARRLSVAVLVRKNDQGRELVQYLRSRLAGLSVVHEGAAAITGNAVSVLLLSLLRYCSHPGDTLALKHLQMSPLHAAISGREHGYRGLPLLVLTQVQRHGFRYCLAYWGEQLKEGGGLDAYGARCLEDLLAAAEKFDASGDRSCNAFLSFVDGYRVQEKAEAGTVRVMTVHQSKGLGFDVVLLPELQDGAMDAGSRDEVAIMDGEQGPVLLDLPQKLFNEADPVLAGALEARRAAAAFDELCVLYVAMTRAKKALYLITGFQGKTSSSLTPGAFVKLRLAGEKNPAAGALTGIAGNAATLLFEKGERQWFQRETLSAEGRERKGRPALSSGYLHAAAAAGLVQVSPSGEAALERSAASLFSAGTSRSLQFGSLVHALFEELAWSGEGEEREAERRWRQKTTVEEDLADEAVRHFEQALDFAAVRKALEKPSADAHLWREKAFDVALEKRWVSGIFDRVVLFPAESGGFARATVIDYKTNRIESRESLAVLADEYRPQMLLYREALAVLLDLPADRIALQLVFTSVGEVVSL